MSRFGEDYEAEYNNAYELWVHNINSALRGKRGKKALTEFREALLALPEKRLIEGALCTVGRKPNPYVNDPQPEGVCAIGAFVWHRLVKLGMTSEQAFEMMPVGEDEWETVKFGKAAGLVGVLAWHFAYMNDEEFNRLTPEDRYERVLAEVEESLATPRVSA